MAAIKGPNIIKNGLVLALDAANVQSFKGEPTTNIAASGGLGGMSGITLTDLGLEDGWRKYSMSGTFTGGTYPYIMHISGYTFTGGVLYTSKCTVKTNVGFKFNYFGTSGINYVNEPMNNGGTAASIANADGSFTVSRSGFAYTNTTSQLGYLLTNPINNTTFNSSTDFVYIKELQVEQKAYATPFVNGTRGTTVATGGGWADRSGNGNHGELVNGPSFNSSNLGGISFDGVNDRVDVARNLGTLSNYSIMFWARRDSENRMPIAARTDTRFYWYGDNSWFYTHGGVGGEYYYSKPTSIPINTWGCYAVVYNGSNVSIYRQGIFQGSQNTSGTANWTDGLMLGYWAAAGPYAWNGLISTVLFYNIALTATEVLQNYNAIKGRYGL
jgi:hypothetical protein